MEIIENININNLKIIQDDSLYRFTSDSVLLSKFVKVKNGYKVADFCSGSGIVAIHTHALNNFNCSYHLFEMQEKLFNLSNKSIKLNNLQTTFTAINCKLQEISTEFNGFFDLIMCNPPYEKENSGVVIEREEIAVCKKELTITLEEIVRIANKKLKFGGHFAIINKAERLAEMIFLMKKNNLEPKRLAFVSGGVEKEPYLVMIDCVKGGKPFLKVEKTIINKGEL